MDPRTATIVVVDDAPEVRLLVRTRLRLTGRLEVVGEGADGEAAIALARTHHPDLMLLDVSMPEMDGLEALPLVLEASPGTRVVLYSGFEQRGLAERARELGAAAFVEKSAPVYSLVDRLVYLAAEEPPAGPPTEQVVAGDAGDTDRPGDTGDAADPGHPGHTGDSGDTSDQGVLDDHRERFREVFEEAAIGMATMTLSGRLVRANRALAALVGRSTADLVGLFYGDLTDGRADQVHAALADIRHRSLDVAHLEHGLARAPEGRHLRATLAPVRDSAGRPLYLLLQVQVVTAERAATDALR
jgi:PAS domain S-box-containing protein